VHTASTNTVFGPGILVDYTLRKQQNLAFPVRNYISSILITSFTLEIKLQKRWFPAQDLCFKTTLKHLLLIFTSPTMLLLFDRCRGSVEISAQQFPKLAYVYAHCRTLRSRFTKRHLTLFQSSMQLFVFGRIVKNPYSVQP